MHPPQAAALRARNLDAALHYSRRSAATLVALAERAGLRQYEVRRIEQLIPDSVPLLRELSPLPDRAACALALARTMDAYLDLTRGAVPENRNPAAETAVRRYLAEAMA